MGACLVSVIDTHESQSEHQKGVETSDKKLSDFLNERYGFDRSHDGQSHASSESLACAMANPSVPESMLTS